ncbi:ing3, putative [Ixodes scapularis]|uniref:Inhibitor of growth protein n=1 Tax=Ixodes scapularis TaxID=6945 RepID=B7PL16_IXOSC|nr:ing3, putative [Ixodes scapularis]|eukprot:XP_002434464.1 ing3, putative [Ixodes scapularis]
MLYLEDYLEMIEHLPQELRDRFTEMREMDLQVQNAMDSLDERVKQFFANARKMKPEQRDQDFDKIRKDYYKALEDADEKVQIANQIYDLVDRYLRRLDQELQKFKMELEADNAGITEILERRKQLFVSSNTFCIFRRSKERFVLQDHWNWTSHLHRAQRPKVSATFRIGCTVLQVVPDAGRPVARPARWRWRRRHGRGRSATLAPPDRLLLPPAALSYGLGSNAIAAAASQAIAATQQMQQGRRTASLKASYEAINASLQSLTSREFTMGSKDIGSLTSLTPPPAPPTPQPSPNPTPVPVAPAAEPRRSSSKKVKRPTVVVPLTWCRHGRGGQPPLVAGEDSGDSLLLLDDNLDWGCDPNEPRYCICNQVSYGDMVACDNDDCPFEWFHYPCVGISQPPKGKWFCPQCTSAMKRRGRKDR